MVLQQPVLINLCWYFWLLVFVTLTLKVIIIQSKHKITGSGLYCLKSNEKATFVIQRACLSLSETASCFTISHKTQSVGWSGEHPRRKCKELWQLNKFTFASVCVHGDNECSLSSSDMLKKNARKIYSETCYGTCRIEDGKAIFLDIFP